MRLRTATKRGHVDWIVTFIIPLRVFITLSQDFQDWRFLHLVIHDFLVLENKFTSNK